MTTAKDEILKFWFEETSPDQWFQKNADFDSEIRNRFEGDYVCAARGEYDHWMETAKGSLALIIMLDQFPRNMYRDTASMFSTDDKALSVARHAIAKNFDHMLNSNERAFMYLPFEHSESMEDQKESLNLFAQLKDDNPVYYDFAVKHFKVIEKYGRFPHRNAILNRHSTQSEEEYLVNSNSGF